MIGDHKQSTEALVGAIVVAAALGFIVYAVQFAETTGVLDGDYLLMASFQSVEGVTVGSDVRLGGIKVGSVAALDLNPETFRADTTLYIDAAFKLPEDTVVAISSEGLLGGHFVEVLPGSSPFTLEAGSEIEGTQSAVSLLSLLLEFVSGENGL